MPARFRGCYLSYRCAERPLCVPWGLSVVSSNCLISYKWPMQLPFVDFVADWLPSLSVASDACRSGCSCGGPKYSNLEEPPSLPRDCHASIAYGTTDGEPVLLLHCLHCNLLCVCCGILYISSYARVRFKPAYCTVLCLPYIPRFWEYVAWTGRTEPLLSVQHRQ